jgi:uncharacterized repeat protein (TIGR03803 family)
MKRIANVPGKLTWGRGACAVFVLCATTATVLSAQTFTTLYSFCSQSGCPDGQYPNAGLVQATNGDLYGTTPGAGAYGAGTVFKITPSGALTTVFNFDTTDGAGPEAPLVQATNGNLYGTTAAGGANNAGTVFRMTPSGRVTTLYSFCSQSGCPDGYSPGAGLVQATNGDFYGTTDGGGANDDGTVFKIAPSGELKTLDSFCYQSGCPGSVSPVPGLIQAINGDFYGTTYFGGSNCAPFGCGTVFKITASGILTTIYSFCSQTACTDGSGPSAGLVQGTNGDFYGTTAFGGVNGNYAGYGTVFKITPRGTLTTLHSFCPQGACTDGAYPQGGQLVLATDGNFYGTTYLEGANDAGTVFKITPGGKLTTLYAFAGTDGASPLGALVQDTNGNLYGTTAAGGAYGDGTVFSLSVGLGPFVEALQTSGKVGAAITILGSDLTGATSVSFNGTAAGFRVVSGSEITTTVPTDATTGAIEVVTSTGTTLSSNVPFRVP